MDLLRRHDLRIICCMRLGSSPMLEIWPPTFGTRVPLCYQTGQRSHVHILASFIHLLPISTSSPLGFGASQPCRRVAIENVVSSTERLVSRQLEPCKCKVLLDLSLARHCTSHSDVKRRSRCARVGSRGRAQFWSGGIGWRGQG